jgi:hypothetical protein
VPDRTHRPGVEPGLWITLDGARRARYSSGCTDSGLPPRLSLAARGALSVSWQVAPTFRPLAVLHLTFRLILHVPKGGFTFDHPGRFAPRA